MTAELLKALQRKVKQYAITNAEIRMSANHRIKGDKYRTGMVLATDHEAQVAVLREAVQEFANYICGERPLKRMYPIAKAIVEATKEIDS